MYIGKSDEISRRAFLKRSGKLAVAGAASSYAMGLAGIGEAAAFNSDASYKALVCVFLHGGNDYANTLIPFDGANYSRYSSIRGSRVAIPQSKLAATLLHNPEDQVLTDGITYSLAPTMPRLKSRFDQGKLAPLMNVGPLEAPLTKAQYEGGNTPRPAFLFSHNDQQSTWQSSKPEGAKTGWGGRMADLAQTSNTNSMFTAMSVAGNGIFLQGDDAVPYRISTRGAPQFAGLQYGRVYDSPQASNALERLLTMSDGHVLKSDYANVNARSIEYGAFINNVLQGGSVSTDFGTGNELAEQLSMVAQLIAARDRLGVKRQIFLVSMGGFDSHSGLTGSHDALLGQLDFAMDAFYRATLELGVSDQVTTFTASDFGRTLSVNGDGSDHGWGGHHFILGGAVRGGRFYGKAPHVSLTSDDQVGRGRLLPTTSVDEYSATLARWFGISELELPSVSPNIGRFAQPDLGFMETPELS
ncbi:DUF1501 domain-containing protein [Altererythrobacter sp.]|uniref:DUF1501 domain-containing protein n=1 Tax=Altererythrobacter sp. TaxID=1872480 RepID=UPI003D10F665